MLVYGANGYTGRLVVDEAVRRGLTPVVGGRHPERVRAVADTHGLEARAFDLDDHPRAVRALTEVDVVAHCAGPFTATAAPMVRACLEAGTHYVDVTGEIEAFDAVYARHDAARAAGVALIPGVGFDVVPTDHLVARLVEQVPDAVGADVAVVSRGGFSRGTLRTAAAGVGAGNRVRSGGRLVAVAHAHRTRVLDLGAAGRLRVASTPLGDVASAPYGYGLTDVTTFTRIPAPGVLRALSPVATQVLGSPIGAAVAHRALGLVPGPGHAVRARTRSTGWAHVYDARGEGLALAVDVANTYDVTARSMVHAALTLGVGGARPGGAFTPANGLGRDFLLTVPGAELSWPRPGPAPLTRPDPAR